LSEKEGENKKDFLLPQEEFIFFPFRGKKAALFRLILTPVAETALDEGKRTQN